VPGRLFGVLFRPQIGDFPSLERNDGHASLLSLPVAEPKHTVPWVGNGNEPLALRDERLALKDLSLALEGVGLAPEDLSLALKDLGLALKGLPLALGGEPQVDFEARMREVPGGERQVLKGETLLLRGERLLFGGETRRWSFGNSGACPTPSAGVPAAYGEEVRLRNPSR
jgi:hypothetical protein